MIPRILHQTWKSSRIPRRFRRYAASWHKYQDFEYRLHNDEQLRGVVAQHVPEHLSLYDRFDHNIERVDFARYVLLHAFGGIYADLDMECLRSLEPLLASGGPVLGTEPAEHAAVYWVDQLLSNALMISPPQHPLWKELLDYVAARYRPKGDVVYNTGPMALTMFHRERPDLFHDVRILPPAAFCPLVDEIYGGKTEGRFRHVAAECRMEDAYTAHHWVHTWFGLGHRVKTACASSVRGVSEFFRKADAGNT